MSEATQYRQLLDNARLDIGRRDATHAPALTARVRATLRRAELDRRLANGVDTTDQRALTVRAWQITRPSTREQLATRFDTILNESDRPRRERGATVPVCREEVSAARGEIARLAERLRDPRPVRPRGVALARRLLTDGTGPLYVPGANDELWRRLRTAVAALD